ncbi:hypothetical protein LC653_30745 [Nostoc sp. CHAB 5784]|nr:hypothetical protein [Nostoc mirabile]MCC5668135.1 hypothetical protein [Nostoc mirabile CHAB5784]
MTIIVFVFNVYVIRNLSTISKTYNGLELRSLFWWHLAITYLIYFH